MDSLLIDTTDFKLEQSELIVRLFVAIGIGFLIGLEREHAACFKNSLPILRSRYS